MKKNQLLICCVLACLSYILILDSCVKDNTDDTKLVIKPEYRGLYVDEFPDVLGDTMEESKMLEWVSRNGFTSLALYSLPIALSTEKYKKQLAAFIQKARSRYGVKDVGACLASAARFYTQVDPYNDSVSTSRQLNYSNLELEWWNNECSYEEYRQELQDIYSWAKSQTPAVKAETYIGWLRNPTGVEMQMATDLLNYTDRILVHDYEKEPSFAYIKERINWIGKAARSEGKVAEVIVIFETEPAYSFDYFTKHTFDEAYSKIINEYLEESFEGKAYVKIKGYQLFAQSSARKCRP